jgi:beta-glucosidase
VAARTLTVFLSTGRCGTQWLTESLVDLYGPRLAVEHEPIGPLYAPRRHFRQWSRPDAILDVPEVRTHVERIAGETHYAETGWPAFAALPLLAERFADRLRVIHLTRHPVPTGLSHLAHSSYAGSARDDAYTRLATLGPDDANVFGAAWSERWDELSAYERCLFWWTEVNLFGLEFPQRRPDIPFARIRSEDLLRGDRDAIDRMLAVMDLPWHDGWLERTGKVVDRWHHHTDREVDPLQVLRHADTVETARRLGYEAADLDLKALEARYRGEPAAGLDRLPFLWGAATSAHQVEGGNTGNDWHDWETRPGTNCAEPSGDACDHVNRYADDIALLAGLGLNTYRFSIEWSRIEPEPGRFSQRWLDHYRAMLEACRAHGLLPVLTFHHFTNPRWIAADGGWENARTAERFGRFCARVTAELGDLMALAITINEPNIPALLGYEEGWHPPGKRDRGARLRATEVLIDGHRRAVEAIRGARPDLPVGMALAMADWQALSGGEDGLAEIRRLREDVFLDATEGDSFVGVNAYTRHRIGPQGWLGNEVGVELTGTGWEFWPEALGATLRRAWHVTGGRTPLMATESGVATDDDTRRIEYVNRAIAGMRAAMRDGVDVRGFLYWSALDNFEWQLGYGPRFGLIEVDRRTQRRTVRPSARHLGRIAVAGR